MDKKIKQRIKKVNEELAKKANLSKFALIIILFGVFVFSGLLFYHAGNNDGYAEKTREIDEQEQYDAELLYMTQPVEVIWHIFLKYLMVKGMLWLPWIVLALLFGWIIHGIW